MERGGSMVRLAAGWVLLPLVCRVQQRTLRNTYFKTWPDHTAYRRRMLLDEVGVKHMGCSVCPRVRLLFADVREIYRI